MSIFGPLIFRPGQHFVGAGMRVSQPMGVAAGDWWEAGGAACCIGAFAAKGAASKAASIVDLSGSGNNLLPSTAFYSTTSWDAINGWGNFLALARTGIKFPITPATNQSWSVFIRFSNASGNNYKALAGTGELESFVLAFAPRWKETYARFWHDETKYDYSGPYYNGVVGVAGNTAYYNGASVGTISQNGGSTTQFYIGGFYGNATDITNQWEGYIQAAAFYNCTLTPTQALAVSTAIAAL